MAEQKISTMPELADINSGDFIEVSEDNGSGGYNTKKYDLKDIVSFKESQLYNGLHTPTDWTLSYDPDETAGPTLTVVVGADTKVNAYGSIVTIEAGTYTKTHADTTGIYYLEITSTGDMLLGSTFNFLTEAIVAYVYYNATTSEGILFDERHPADPGWPASIHRHAHQTVGAVIVSGGAITGITEDSNADASMQFSISQTVFDDESLRITLDELVGGAGKYTILYRSGADGDNEWSYHTAQDLPIYESGDNPYYNQLTGGSWQLTEISSNNRWVNYYLIGTNAIETEFQYLLIPGQAIHTSLTSAESEDFLGSINFGDFPIAEIVPLAKFTYRRATATGNNFYIDEWVNIRGTRASLSVTTIPSSHNSLTDRDDPSAHPLKADKLILETAEKTADYTLTIDDKDKIVLMNKATAGTLTVPKDDTEDFPIGSIVGVYNASAADLTISGAADVTVRNAGDLAQYGEVSLRKRAANEWVLAGSVS